MGLRKFLIQGAGKSFKGQVALEYLITYGWVMFLLLIALGVVALSTSNLTGAIEEECIFPQQILCNGVSLVDGTPNAVNVNDIDTFKINLTNNFGHSIVLYSFSISYKELDSPVVKDLNEQVLEDGESIVLTINTKGIERGRKYNIRSTLTYAPCDVEGGCLNDEFNITGYVYAEAV